MKGPIKTFRGWLMFMLPSLILWNIWKARNKYRFNVVHVSYASILELIKVDICQLYKASNKLLPKQLTLRCLEGWKLALMLTWLPCL